jgi:hypothetical protein
MMRGSAALLLSGVLVLAPVSSHAQSPDRLRKVETRLVETPFGPVRVTQLDVRHAAHADSGMLSIAYLKRVQGKLITVRSFPKAVISGSFGHLGTWTIDRRFSRWPVIRTSGGGTWMGQTCMWTTKTEHRPQGPLEMVTFEQSFSSGDDPIDISGKISSIERGRSFTVRFSGTENFTATYLRKANAYKLQGGNDRELHGC